MSKLCIIQQTAPKYREAIFCAIDKEYDCDWYFGKTKTDIKEMDVSKLSNVHYYRKTGDEQKWFLKFGIISLLFKRKYQTYLILPSTRCVTDWIFFWIAFTFFPKKRLYLWTHGWYGKESGREAKMKLWLYRHAAGTFVYGNFARGLLIKEGIQDDKVFTIHNSLQYDEQKTLRESLTVSSLYSDHFGNNNPVIIFIGRLTKVKKLDMIVDAVKELKAKGEEYNVVFVGDGVERESLELRAESLEIKDQVWFYGECYDEKTNGELIYNADLCVAPGNIGLTAMHTMVFGTPCISHNDFKWQMPEFEAIKSGVTGGFFERDNVQSLADTISNWFSEKKGKREEVRKACFEEIDSSWNPYYQMDVIKKHIIMR